MGKICEEWGIRANLESERRVGIIDRPVADELSVDDPRESNKLDRRVSNLMTDVTTWVVLDSHL